MIRRFALCFSFLLLLSSVAVFAAQPPQFSADTKFSSPRGPGGTGKLFFGGDKFRMEMNTAGHDMIVINDLNKKVAYNLMPQQHMYMEISTETQGPHHMPEWRTYDSSNPCASMPGTTCQKVGAETVNGYMCDKWLLTDKDRQSSRTVWIDQKTGIPIKSVSSRGTEFELMNIKTGTQDSKLFEIPAGYQKIDIGNMMQMQRPH